MWETPLIPSVHAYSPRRCPRGCCTALRLSHTQASTPTCPLAPWGSTCPVCTAEGLTSVFEWRGYPSVAWFCLAIFDPENLSDRATFLGFSTSMGQTPARTICATCRHPPRQAFGPCMIQHLRRSPVRSVGSAPVPLWVPIPPGYPTGPADPANPATGLGRLPGSPETPQVPVAACVPHAGQHLPLVPLGGGHQVACARPAHICIVVLAVQWVDATVCGPSAYGVGIRPFGVHLQGQGCRPPNRPNHEPSSGLSLCGTHHQAQAQNGFSHLKRGIPCLTP